MARFLRWLFAHARGAEFPALTALTRAANNAAAAIQIFPDLIGASTVE